MNRGGEDEPLVSSSRPPRWLIFYAAAIFGAVIGGVVGGQFVQPAIGFWGTADLGPFFKGTLLGAIVGLTLAVLTSVVVSRSRH